MYSQYTHLILNTEFSALPPGQRVPAATGNGRGTRPRCYVESCAFLLNSAVSDRRALSIIYLELYKPIYETGNSVAGLFINEPVHKLMGSVLM